MRSFIEDFFQLKEHKTSIQTEVIAGFTTFITMAYIIIVNPKILEVAGIPFEASMAATIVSAFFGTLLMGVYAKRPFAIAPYMGENAFIAFTVVKVLGYSWQTAIGAIFIGGCIFTLITLLKIRSYLANSIPSNLKIGFTVGIGLFLTFIGLNETGIVTVGVPGAPVKTGNFRDPEILLSIFCFMLIVFLMIKKIKGSILIGILVTSVISFIIGVSPLPEKLISSPPNMSPIFMKFDLVAALNWGFFAVILTVFVMDFVDTLGTLIGLGVKADLLDENGNLPYIEKPMLCDALATIIGAVCGTTTTGTYIESAAGIEAGGKTGLTAVVTAVLFLSALFFAPLFISIPALAYGPALIIVGVLMISPIKNINFEKPEEVIPAFVSIVMMCFTYNLGIGMTSSFIIYVIISIFTGEFKKVGAGMWFLSGLSLLFYIFYPY